MIDQRFCDACGKPNREFARFCGYCGRSLQNTGSEKNTLSTESREKTGWFPIAGNRLNGPDFKRTGNKAVKSKIFVILTLGLLGLLAYTNPTLNGYESFVHQQIIQESKTDMERALGFFFGDFASRFVASQTIRKDYVFLSTYDTNVGDEHLRALGVLNNFILLETPRSLKARH
jgi:hypothetical protein